MREATINFDYIFAGGGMAAASLLLRILDCPELQDKQILIADPDAFSCGEKTWCYWEKGQGFFENLVEKDWSRAWFHAPGFSKELKLEPYRYKMLRSSTLFGAALKMLEGKSNVKIIRNSVSGFSTENGKILVKLIDGKAIRGKLVFNSIPDFPEKKPGHFYLLQHFKGWFVRTKEAIFNSESATLMDFKIEQNGDCRFIYILPQSAYEALVEFTVFSASQLPDEEYERALSTYMRNLAPGGYEIIQKEKGVIPMFSEAFPSSGIPGLIQIGTCGGMTKASTGYTFMKVQKHSDAIVRDLLSGRLPDADTLKTSARFFWFDRVLLRILSEKIMPGSEIFRMLFEKNPAERVFRFLDEETGYRDELRIMNSVPALKFIIPGLKELLRKS